MKHINIFIVIFLIVFNVMTSLASDGEMIFSYDNAGESHGKWGTKKRERYDVAIIIEKGMLDGALLKGVEIPVNGANKMTDVSIWIASELSEYGGLETICSYPVDMSKDYDSDKGSIACIFPESYKIAEGMPTYVGYSFSISALNSESSEPLVVVPGNTGQTYVRANSLNKLNNWVDLGRSQGYSSCMRVLVGDAKNGAACFMPLKTMNIQSGKENAVSTSIINHGASKIETIVYEGKIGSMPFTGNISLDSPLPNIFGATREVSVSLPAIEENGSYKLELKVKSVNGNANEDASQVSADVNVYAFIPVKRPLMEEYTANSCGYCPKGVAAFEIMKERYGDDFVAVSFHTAGDPLDLFANLPILNSESSIALPTSQMDRVLTIDPYLGAGKSGFGLDKCWDERAELFTVASIGLNGGVSGNEATLTADVEFLKAINEGSYRVEFFIAADGLTNPKWIQKNYFSKNEDARALPGLDKYVDSPGSIVGIVYDDVVVAWSGKDDAIKLPAAQAYEKITVSKTLTIPEIAKDGRFRGIAAVMDCTTGEVLNSIQCNFDGAGVDISEIESQPVQTTFWSLQGIPMANPEGICIRQDKFADGTCRYAKMYIRK